MNTQVGEEVIEIIRMNPTMKRRLELEIRTLQNAPRDEGKLRELLKLKEMENEQEATHILKTHKKVSYRRN